jgi:GNAT superfamily N-acetyltransferase
MKGSFGMVFPQELAGPHETLVIMPAQKKDLPEILALFDEAVAWLVIRGIVDQWGTEPFSKYPSRWAQFQGWIDRGAMFVARRSDKHSDNIVGTLAVGAQAPWYLTRYTEFPSSAFYLEAFTTSRSVTGQGIGRTLLQWAEQYTLQSGRSELWLDCWADNPDLCRYYQKAGFVPRELFYVGEWHGQYFEKQLAGPASF